jgi:DmsA/YnfE family anaerobic dimethyl sulfoxide reductase A subunit
LRVFTRRGFLARVEGDNSGEKDGVRELRACLRGRALRQAVYSPDRLKYPLRRTGRRGEGKFERLSWDEALDEVAAALRRTLERYGNEAVCRLYGAGTINSTLGRREEFFRLMNLLGGHLELYGNYSSAQLAEAAFYTYGERAGNSYSDLVNSRLLVMFGGNPAETHAGGGSASYDLLLALRKSKARRVFIDPRHSDSVALFADEWIPVKPGTDAALASALAYVIIAGGFADEGFLDKYCVGYDRKTLPPDLPPGSGYKDYILGKGRDRTPKTPAWASAITGCPVSSIERLGRELGTLKPAFVVQGLGPQRQAYGEQNARAVMMLAALTGNVGIAGGNTGLQEGSRGIKFPLFPAGENPVRVSLPCFLWDQAVERGEELTARNAGVRGAERLRSGIKFIWSSGSDIIANQHADLNRAGKILLDESKCETLVVVETRFTPSARFADILLPSTYPVEEGDIFYQGYAMHLGMLLVAGAAVPPPGEARTQYDICAALAGRLGVGEAYSQGRKREDWLEFMYRECRRVKPELPADLKEAVRHGPYKWASPETLVAFGEFRRDPEKFPLRTPSGKIEIFSRRILEMSRNWEFPPGDGLQPLPQYVPAWEGAEEDSAFPLQLIGHHFKGRVHSSFAGLPWLSKSARHSLWICPEDATPRGIRHGDALKIFNRRGVTLAPAKVTPRIMPGVVSLPQGAWRVFPSAGQSADPSGGEDPGGNVNVLTRARPSPLAKGNTQHTVRVEVQKAGSAGDVKNPSGGKEEAGV